MLMNACIISGFLCFTDTVPIDILALGSWWVGVEEFL
jgi:hypothetical protein